MESLHKHPAVTKLALVNSVRLAKKFDSNLPFLDVLTSDKITTVQRKNNSEFDGSFFLPNKKNRKGNNDCTCITRFFFLHKSPYAPVTNCERKKNEK